MLRILGVLVVSALISATGAYAQMDWGTDADSVITIFQAVGAVDMPGEGGITVGAGQPMGAPKAESTVVQPAFNMGMIGMNADKPAMPSDTLWMPYFIRNMSNRTDSIHISATVFNNNMDVMDILIASDEEGDTMINLMGTDFIASTTGQYGLLLPEDGFKILFVGAVIPDTSIDGDSAIYSVVISDNMGTGINDGWPMNYPAYLLASDYGDQQADTFMVAIGMPIITFGTMASKMTALPGDTIMYTLMYDNDGSDSTNVAGGGQLFITQLLPQYVKYMMSSFDYSAVHIGANATPMFSSHSNATMFVQNETWANTWPDSVAGFQVTFAGDIQGQDNSETTDSVGIADGEMPDFDAGQITFKVIVK